MINALSVAIKFITDYLLFETVIAAVLISIAWGIIGLGKIKTPVHRHLIWFFTLIAIVIMPVLWLYGPKLTLSILPSRNSIGLLQLTDLQAAFRPDGYSFWSLLTGFNILAWLWCIGFIFLLSRLLVGGYRLSRIIHFARPVTASILPQKASSRKIKLLLTTQLESPVCLGLFRPIILLPEEMYYNSSPEDLRMVLRHEYAHVVRKDCWVNLFQRVVEAVLFFHPLVWYASFQLTQQREQLCDNHVIAEGVSPTNYAKMLSRIVEQGFEKKCFHAVALFEGKLLGRVRSLLEPGNKNQIRASRRAIATGVMVMLLFFVIGTIQIEATSEVIDSKGFLGKEKQGQTESLFASALEINEIDQLPMIISRKPLRYPNLAKVEGVEGMVMLRYIIGTDGHVYEPEVISAEPEGFFEEAALATINGYTYEPASKNGKPVACIVKQPVSFTLKVHQAEK